MLGNNGECGRGEGKDRQGAGLRCVGSAEYRAIERGDTSSGCGRSFEVTIVSASFEGVSLVQRHRRINTLFQAELAGQIHAFTLKTWTPAQYHSARLTTS